jgi:predicted CopG family antitoxin
MNKDNKNTELDNKDENLNISDVISRLLSLQRVDIDTLDNGEFIEKDERIEEDGRYIISEDLDKLISELKRSL